VSGVLNSNPDKALEWQRNNGDVRFFAWDIAKYRGRDVSGRPYVERRALLDKVVAQVRMFNRSYETVDVKPDCVSAVEYFRSVVSGNGPLSEGVVLKEANASDPRWFKVKRFDAYDLEITEFVEGSGKYAGSLGALRVRSPQTGEIGEIGSFAVPDTERQWLWQHRQELAGGYAQIQAMELSEARGVPRAGVFLAMHPGKGAQAAVEALALREI
jgi:ATP-dependent DNA ligase